MEDRRRIKRRHLLYYGRIYDETAQEFLGYLVDITENGFMLLGDKAFPVDQVRRFKLEITDDVDSHPFMNFTARSIWCEPDIDPDHFDTGFEFTVIKPTDRQIIDRIVEKYSFRDN